MLTHDSCVVLCSKLSNLVEGSVPTWISGLTKLKEL